MDRSQSNCKVSKIFSISCNSEPQIFDKQIEFVRVKYNKTLLNYTKSEISFLIYPTNYYTMSTLLQS